MNQFVTPGDLHFMWLVNIYFYAKFHCATFKNEGDKTISVFQFGKIAVVVAVAVGMLRT